MPGTGRNGGCVGGAAVPGRGAQEEQAAPGSRGSRSGGSREWGEGSRGMAKPLLLLARTPGKKQQVNLKAASTPAAGALRHPSWFFQGKIAGPDAPRSQADSAPRARNTTEKTVRSTRWTGTLSPPHSPALPREELRQLGSISLFLLRHRSRSSLRFRNN